MPGKKLITAAVAAGAFLLCVTTAVDIDFLQSFFVLSDTPWD